MSDGGGPPNVAVIGLGKMGSGLAHNIVEAGFPTTVWNRSEAKTVPFVAAGARAAATPREAAAGADVVVSSLFDDASVLASTEGDDGILAGLAPAAVHCGTTTVSPDCTRRLTAAHERHGSRYVAAHVLGRPDAARAGQLLVLAGGPADAVEQSRPVLDAFSRGVIAVAGDPQLATHLKLMANYTIVASLELFGEVYAWGEKAGLDKPQIQLMLDGLLTGPILPAYNERVAGRDFADGGFALEGGRKDVETMLSAAGEVHVPLPFANVLRDRLLTALGRDMGDLDWAALTEIARDAAALE